MQNGGGAETRRQLVARLFSLVEEESARIREVQASPNRVPEGRDEVLSRSVLDAFAGLDDPALAPDGSSWSVLLAFAWPALLVGLLFWRKRGSLAARSGLGR